MGIINHKINNIKTKCQNKIKLTSDIEKIKSKLKKIIASANSKYLILKYPEINKKIIKINSTLKKLFNIANEELLTFIELALKTNLEIKNYYENHNKWALEEKLFYLKANNNLVEIYCTCLKKSKGSQTYLQLIKKIFNSGLEMDSNSRILSTICKHNSYRSSEKEAKNIYFQSQILKKNKIQKLKKENKLLKKIIDKYKEKQKSIVENYIKNKKHQPKINIEEKKRPDFVPNPSQKIPKQPRIKKKSFDSAQLPKKKRKKKYSIKIKKSKSQTNDNEGLARFSSETNNKKNENIAINDFLEWVKRNLKNKGIDIQKIVEINSNNKSKLLTTILKHFDNLYTQKHQESENFLKQILKLAKDFKIKRAITECYFNLMIINYQKKNLYEANKFMKKINQSYLSKLKKSFNEHKKALESKHNKVIIAISEKLKLKSNIFKGIYVKFSLFLEKKKFKLAGKLLSSSLKKYRKNPIFTRLKILYLFKTGNTFKALEMNKNIKKEKVTEFKDLIQIIDSDIDNRINDYTKKIFKKAK
ncbi:hypothetical protein ACFL2K_02110 [Candidatus Margulisiibacteriota bacterium]